MQTFVLRDQIVFKRLQAFLAANWVACAQAQRPLAVTVAEHRAKRSTEQNKFYWALLRQVAADGWINGQQFDEDCWHEHFKRTLIGVEEVVLPDGVAITRGISTTTLSVAQMSEYVERVQAFAAEALGLELV